MLKGSLAGVYVGLIGALFVRGEGIAAAYFTMPAWWLVAGVYFATEWLGIPAAQRVLYSWTGNFVLLILSALLNVGGVALLLRWSQPSRLLTPRDQWC